MLGKRVCVSVWVLTPTDGQVNVEVFLLAENSDDEEAVQIDAFHQQPVVVGDHAVLHHHHGASAPHHGLKYNTVKREGEGEKQS